MIELISYTPEYWLLMHKWHSTPGLYEKLALTHLPDKRETFILCESWRQDPATRIFLLKYRERIIGYVRLAGINPEHKYCELHTVVGDPKLFGRPVCVEVVDRILDLCFNHLEFERVGTFVLGDNPKLYKTAVKYGWKYEGTLRALLVSRTGERLDYHIFGMLKKEFKKRGRKCQ